jgi:hypothetical protein
MLATENRVLVCSGRGMMSLYQAHSHYIISLRHLRSLLMVVTNLSPGHTNMILKKRTSNRPSRLQFHRKRNLRRFNFSSTRLLRRSVTSVSMSTKIYLPGVTSDVSMKKTNLAMFAVNAQVMTVIRKKGLLASTLPVENVRTKIANTTEELIIDFFCFSPSFPDCVQTHLI